MNRSFISFIIFCGVLLCSSYGALNSWNGLIYVYVGDARTPAAVQKKLDVSNLQGSDLFIASRDRLLNDAHLILHPHETGIQLGHFIVKSSDGTKQFACKVYQRVRLIYQADGMAESGSIPQMSVEGPCMISEDINHMAPLWIPQQKFLAQRPHDFDIDYEEHDTTMSFHFQDIGSNWPDTWTLRSLSLFDPENSGPALEFTPQDLLSLRPKHLTLHWDHGAAALAPQLPDPSEK